MRVWAIYQGSFGEWRWRSTTACGAVECATGFSRLRDCTAHVVASGFDPAWDHLVIDEGAGYNRLQLTVR